MNRQDPTAAASDSARRTRLLRQSARYLSRRPSLLFGGLIVVLFVAVGLLAPLIAPYPYAAQDLISALKPPLSPHHLLGTDQFGRDLLSRILYGARTSFIFAIGVTVLSVLLGVVVGGVSGYFGGIIDLILAAIVDLMWAFPIVLAAVLFVGLLGPGLEPAALAITVVNWAGTARIVRGEVIALREREFVEAARALGRGHLFIIFRHMIPNALPAVLVLASFSMGIAILVEASLSFIGLGAQPPLPSWGDLLSEGWEYNRYAPWLVIVPGVSIVIIVLGFNVLGDALREALDPRLRER
jgi:peptide/nickel transport system permease protein